MTGAADRLPAPPPLPGYTRESAELGGGGATSLVYQERCNATGEVVAVKYMPRAELRLQAPGGIDRELRAHALAVHPHVAGFRDVLLLPEWVAIVAELCEGHNLLTWLNQQPQRRATEAVARGIVAQILAAVQRMHSAGMMHRDLKADNICLARPAAVGEVPVLKIIDFGTAKIAQLHSKPNSLVGTYYYMSPELFNVHRAQSNGEVVPTYDGFKVDTWAIGITLHILLRGEYPFDGQREGLTMTRNGTLSKELLEALRDSVIVSPECTDFITQCFTFDGAQRPTAEQLASHPWMQGTVPAEAPGAAVGDPAVMAKVDDVLRRIQQGLP